MEIQINGQAITTAVGGIVGAYLTVGGLIILANEPATVATGYFSGAIAVLLLTLFVRHVVWDGERSTAERDSQAGVTAR